MRAAKIVLGAFLLVVLAAVSASCSRTTVRGSGNVTTRQVAVSTLSRLEVASAFEVSVAVGGQPSLSLRVDDNLQRHVEAEVNGETLRIGLERGTSVSDATLQAEITAPSLTQVQASGASRISLDDRLKGNNLRLELSGASRMDGGVDLGSMTTSLSGASELTLSGQLGRLSASASGASRFELLELQVDELEVSLSGASCTDHGGC
jgi:hypothetical protein